MPAEEPDENSSLNIAGDSVGLSSELGSLGSKTSIQICGFGLCNACSSQTKLPMISKQLAEERIRAPQPAKDCVCWHFPFFPTTQNETPRNKITIITSPSTRTPIYACSLLMSAEIASPSYTSSDITLPVPGPSVIPQHVWPEAMKRPWSDEPSISGPLKGPPGR